jgi:hypothetical protein
LQFKIFFVYLTYENNKNDFPHIDDIINGIKVVRYDIDLSQHKLNGTDFSISFLNIPPTTNLNDYLPYLNSLDDPTSTDINLLYPLIQFYNYIYSQPTLSPNPAPSTSVDENNSKEEEDMRMNQKGGKTINTNPPPSRSRVSNTKLKQFNGSCKEIVAKDPQTKSDEGFAADYYPECTTNEKCRQYRTCVGEQLETETGRPYTLAESTPFENMPPLPGPTCTRWYAPTSSYQRFSFSDPICAYAGGSRKRSSRPSKKNPTSSRMARRTRSTRRRSTRKGSRKSRRSTRRNRK